MRHPGKRTILVTVLSVSLLMLGLTPLATAQDSTPEIVVVDGKTQPAFGYEDAVRETLWIEAPMDSDGDGRNDRVRADIIRPAETEEGLKVPTIMEPSPYYPRGEWDEPREFNGWWDEHFVPRGYAVMHMEMQGTARSEGCPSVGGVEDTLSIKAAVDWLNGRAPGEHLDGSEAEAYWSTGDVAMQGRSYRGTLPNAVAVEGVEGLRTVVPMAAISSWYDYTSADGIRFSRWDNEYVTYLANYVMSSNPEARENCADYVEWLGDQSEDDTGNYSDFWQLRNYRPDANKIKTSDTAVFMVHGWDDWNVKRKHTSEMWYEIERRQMPRKIWLHQGGHASPESFRFEEWREEMHAWMDHWLHGIDNGVMDEPMAELEQPDGTWVTEEKWPPEDTADVRLRFGPANDEVVGTLGFKQTPGNQKQSWVDTSPRWWQPGEDAWIEDPAEERTDRLAFVTPPLEEDVRISGTPEVEVRVTPGSTSAPVSAVLVDYGVGPTTTTEGRTPFELMTESCELEDYENQTGCFAPEETTTEITSSRMVSRGHIDLRNHANLFSSPDLEPGEEYNARFKMQPHDYVFEKGHRIGVVITGNHPEIKGVPEAVGEEMTVHLNGSRIHLPIVGGSDAVGF